jgi:hypothetical protein
MVEASVRRQALKNDSTALMYRMPDCEPVEIAGGVKSIMPLPFESVRQLMRIRNKQRPIWNGAVLKKNRNKETRL